ncbi:hypothetical protein [Actinosynnema sp. NPDC020468]|uniref:hypothetical protein n=1 Tax=Actinosynnema sp. NPDC020468 TaxID=3154488 RepID=UPI0033E7B2BA
MTEWLLLSDPSPALRRRVLTELLDVPADDPEVRELVAARAASAEVAALVEAEPVDHRDLAYRLCRFAQLGLDRTHGRVAEFTERLPARQRDDGSFPFADVKSDGRYDLIPLRTALPLRGLAAVGYARDPRVERGDDRLVAQRLGDGSWPVGYAAGQPAYVAGYRRLPGSAGCRANTRAAVACLVPHPSRRVDPVTRTGVDLVLRRETRDEWALGAEPARLLGEEPVAGFFTFSARFDLAHVLDRDPRRRVHRGPEGGRPGRVPGRAARAGRRVVAPGAPRAVPVVDLRPRAQHPPVGRWRLVRRAAAHRPSVTAVLRARTGPAGSGGRR